MRQSLLPVCLILFFARCVAPLCAENPSVQQLAWNADANVLEYRVEIQHKSSGKTDVLTTARNYIEVSLEAGTYRYRVTAYDMLGRASQVSDWVDFEVFKANKPKITAIDEKNMQEGEDGKVALSVDIANISPGSTVELIRDSEAGSFDAKGGRAAGQAGNETGRADTVYFDQVTAGTWRLKVTNPSGLSTESEPFEVPEKSPPPQAVAETLQNAALAGGTPDGTGIAPASNGDLTADETSDGAESSAESADNLRPYHSITLSAGAGVWFSPYDAQFVAQNNVTYFGQKLVPALVAQIQFLPFRAARRDHGGFSLFFDGTRLFYRSDAYNATTTTALFGAQFVYHRALVSDRLFAAFKAGGGAALVQSEVAYKEESGVNIDIGYSLRAANGNARVGTARAGATGGANGTARASSPFADGTTAFYPCARAGLSLVWVPFTRLSVELGADFTHIFIADMPTGIVTPYLTLGLRL